ncbi:defective proboscis extension response (dpr)-related [Clonorchis sinensis]|uniref:Defective proboscis extension response (Dpr)-related n=1 Tax=Clonorchis sinensis TaxID=79923 RepID=H2KQ53_CLOSI|nr:defective proboscis extension response (dpr)-related [Clonorchis sinensis]
MVRLIVWHVLHDKIYRVTIYLAILVLYVHTCLILFGRAISIRNIDLNMVVNRSTVILPMHGRNSSTMPDTRSSLKHLPRLANLNPTDSVNFDRDASANDCHFEDRYTGRGTSTTPCFMGTVKTRIAAEEGSLITLQCVIYNVNFSTIVISWWRDGHMRELTLGLETSDPRYSLPRLSYQDWSLQIARARMDDSGIYICQINLEQILEKFYYVTVKPAKPSLMNYQPVVEHEFVKDEAVQHKSNLRIRIEGRSEGIAGETLTLTCVTEMRGVSKSANLVWSHGTGTHRTYISPSSTTFDTALILRDPKSSQAYNGSHLKPAIQTATSRRVRITEKQYANYTIRSQLTFQPLLVEHAGLWKCVKIGHPLRTILEEAETMVYVRSKVLPALTRQVGWSDHSDKDSSRGCRFYPNIIVIIGARFALRMLFAT